MTQRISGPRGRAGSRIARRTRRPGRVVGAICGVLAAAVAIGIAQLLAGLSIPAASPVIAVGQAAIDLTPLPVKDWATSTFGTADKTVLLLGVFVLLFLFAVVVGILAMRRLSFGLAGLCLFAVIGLVASSRPASSPIAAAATVTPADTRKAGRAVASAVRGCGGRVRAVPAGDVRACGVAVGGGGRAAAADRVRLRGRGRSRFARFAGRSRSPR